MKQLKLPMMPNFGVPRLFSVLSESPALDNFERGDVVRLYTTPDAETESEVGIARIADRWVGDFARVPASIVESALFPLQRTYSGLCATIQATPDTRLFALIFELKETEAESPILDLQGGRQL